MGSLRFDFDPLKRDSKTPRILHFSEECRDLPLDSGAASPSHYRIEKSDLRQLDRVIPTGLCGDIRHRPRGRGSLILDTWCCSILRLRSAGCSLRVEAACYSRTDYMTKGGPAALIPTRRFCQRVFARLTTTRVPTLLAWFTYIWSGTRTTQVFAWSLFLDGGKPCNS